LLSVNSSTFADAIFKSPRFLAQMPACQTQASAYVYGELFDAGKQRGDCRSGWPEPSMSRPPDRLS
jgi:hypothetical protein